VRTGGGGGAKEHKWPKGRENDLSCNSSIPREIERKEGKETHPQSGLPKKGGAGAREGGIRQGFGFAKAAAVERGESSKS